MRRPTLAISIGVCALALASPGLAQDLGPRFEQGRTGVLVDFYAGDPPRALSLDLRRRYFAPKHGLEGRVRPGDSLWIRAEPGPLEAWVHCLGYLPAQIQTEVRAGYTTHLGVIVRQGEQLSGRVIGGSGPIRGTVRCCSRFFPGHERHPSQRAYPVVSSAEVGPDGRFTLSAVDWDLIASLSFSLPGYFPLELTEITPRGEALLELPREVTFTVRVEGPDGRPVAGAEVTHPSADPEQPVLTGADGEAHWRGAYPNLIGGRAKVKAVGFKDKEQEVFLEDNARGRVVVRLRSTEEQATLSGTVVDPWGQPLEGAFLLAIYQSGPSETVLTDSAGRYALKGCTPDEPFRLTIRHLGCFDGHAKRVVPAEGLSDDLIVLSRGVQLQYRVVGESAEHADALSSRLTPLEPLGKQNTSGQSGRGFRSVTVTPGRWSVRVTWTVGAIARERVFLLDVREDCCFLLDLD